jgi:hypothetical protein
VRSHFASANVIAKKGGFPKGDEKNKLKETPRRVK